MSKSIIPKSLFSRSKELLTTAARVGQKEIAYRFRNSALKDSKIGKQIEQAELIVETLSRLKGAAMKTGQFLSLDATELLPPEISEVFSKLQNKSPHFLEENEIHEILKQQLGDEKFAELESLSSQPIAAASIGQVHLAKWKNESLAIKVQYPGVAESIETDLSLLKSLLSGYLKLSGRRMELDSLFKELENVFKGEVDYNQELKNILEFSDGIKDLKEYKVPRVFPELSGAKVLSMSFEGGVPLKDWIAQKPKNEERQIVGPRLLELYFREFYEWGLVQTDPNLGNFLIDPSTLQLTLLDFGALKRYPKEFRRVYAEFLRLTMNNDNEKALEVAFTTELISPKETKECQQALLNMILASLESVNPLNQPFRFADKDYFEDSKRTSLEFTRLIKHTAPPHQIIFLHRKLAGVYNILRKLEVQMDLSVYWKKWVLES